MESELSGLDKEEAKKPVSEMSCFPRIIVVHRLRLIELASAVKTLIQLSECHKKKKKSNLGLMGQAPCHGHHAKKPSTFAGIREQPTSGQSVAWRSHCLARWSQPSCTAGVWMGRTLFHALTAILSMKFNGGLSLKTTGASSRFKPKRLSSDKYSLKSRQCHWNWW